MDWAGFVHIHICVWIKSVSQGTAFPPHNSSARYFMSYNSALIELLHLHNYDYNNLEIYNEKPGKRDKMDLGASKGILKDISKLNSVKISEKPGSADGDLQILTPTTLEHLNE